MPGFFILRGGETVKKYVFSALSAQHVFVQVSRKKTTASEVLDDFRSYVHDLIKVRERLRNPVNLKTGKPLSPSTIQNFEIQLERIRESIKMYRALIKWLRLCGYFGKKNTPQIELEPEQRFVRWVLKDVKYREDRLARYDRAYGDLRRYEEKAEMAKERADFWKKRVEFWGDHFDIAIDRSNEIVRPKKKRIPNTLGFKLIDGGRKF
jgi:hypothetical protein